MRSIYLFDLVLKTGPQADKSVVPAQLRDVQLHEVLVKVLPRFCSLHQLSYLIFRGG